MKKEEHYAQGDGEGEGEIKEGHKSILRGEKITYDSNGDGRDTEEK